MTKQSCTSNIRKVNLLSKKTSHLKSRILGQHILCPLLIFRSFMNCKNRRRKLKRSRFCKEQ